MSHIPRNKDWHLHNPDGTHRATPPTTKGAGIDLFWRQMARHRARHNQKAQSEVRADRAKADQRIKKGQETQ